MKSLTQEGSTGISQASVVHDETKLRERVQFIHESIGTDAILERYIEGRELYVGIIGNSAAVGVPGLGAALHQARRRGSPDRHRTGEVEPEVSAQVRHQDPRGEAAGRRRRAIQYMCKRVYRSLDLSGYARIDLRMDGDGKAFVIEANPNPQLGYGEDFAESAERAGVSYEQLLQRIILTGLQWRPERRG